MARFAGEVSGGAQAVAIGWYLYNLTDSALALGFLGLARFIPTLSLVLVTGLVADRYGDVSTYQFDGLTARVFLHELDHLDGLTFMKRAHPTHIDRAKMQMKKLNRQKRRNANV